jgi:multiple antibiotic resistance protein
LLRAEDSEISHNPLEEQEALKKSSIAVVPLAIPIIAGPGAISTAIVFNSSYPTLIGRMMLTMSSVLVAVTIGLCLVFATRLERLLGAAGMNIMGRIGGLILAAIAVETMSKGIIALFPGLAG